MALKDPQKELEERDEKIADLEEKLANLEGKMAELIEENERLRGLLGNKAKSKSAKTPKFSGNYSAETNGRRSKKNKRGKGATGRRRRGDKQAFVSHTEQVYPDHVDPADCVYVRTQYAWRIVAGRALYIGYEIYDLPGSQQAPLPCGLRNSRSEFGLEVSLIVAFLHYLIGVSLDHSCQIIEFFTALKLSKSQAHSLLEQLSDDRRAQEQAIAALIAWQWIVCISTRPVGKWGGNPVTPGFFPRRCMFYFAVV